MYSALWIVCCGGICLVLPTIGSAVWYIVDVFRGQVAHVRLAEAGDYELLHDHSKGVQKIFGGEINGRSFAFRPHAKTSRGYDTDGHSRTNVQMQMRVLFPLSNPKLAEVDLKRDPKAKGTAQAFADIWTPTSKAAHLSEKAQAILFDFATAGHPPGFYGVGYRFRKQLKSVTIRRRDMINALPKGVFPDTPSFLIYDHPHANVNLQRFEEVIQELSQLVERLEAA